MEEISRVGIDLGKRVHQVCGVNGADEPVLQRQMRGPRLMELMARLKPCLVGLEACGGAHHWVDELKSLGHDARMMSPQFVRAYVKSNKSDFHDAAAICEAVGRPTMRFVPHKTKERRALQQVHRTRQLQVRLCTQLGNQMRGFLREYGIVLPLGLHVVRREVPDIASDAANGLPSMTRWLLWKQYDSLVRASEEVESLTSLLEQESKGNPLCRRLLAVPGFGPITSTALVAAVGDARVFRSGREMAAWIGLVPRQASTGGRTVLLGISKRGDRYLRALLVHGARAVLRTAHLGRRTRLKERALALKKNRGSNIATVAIANKMARTAWALLRHDDYYRAEHAGPNRAA